jgi:hypothetical protein
MGNVALERDGKLNNCFELADDFHVSIWARSGMT